MADLTGKIVTVGAVRVNNQTLDTIDEFYRSQFSGAININLRPNSGFVGIVTLYRKEKDDNDTQWSLVRTFTESELAITEAYVDSVLGTTDFAIGLTSLTTADLVCDMYSSQYT